MIMLSEDPKDVAYIGLDVQNRFDPLNIKGFEAHSMIGADNAKYPGYLDRIVTLIKTYSNETYPVSSTGYISGTLCTQDIECASGHCGKETSWSWNRCIGTSCTFDSDCESNRCDSGVCIPKLGSCMFCDEDSDCTSGKCSSLFRCFGEDALMDNDCNCLFDSDCRSGRCEGVSSRVCEAKLSQGAYCNENADCLSGYCSWKFVCEETVQHSWWQKDSWNSWFGQKDSSTPHQDSLTANFLVSADNIRQSRTELAIEQWLNNVLICIAAFFASAITIIFWSGTVSMRRRREYEEIPPLM
jgi:hypothetical protein